MCARRLERLGMRLSFVGWRGKAIYKIKYTVKGKGDSGGIPHVNARYCHRKPTLCPLGVWLLFPCSFFFKASRGRKALYYLSLHGDGKTLFIPLQWQEGALSTFYGAASGLRTPKPTVYRYHRVLESRGAQRGRGEGKRARLALPSSSPSPSPCIREREEAIEMMSRVGRERGCKRGGGEKQPLFFPSRDGGSLTSVEKEVGYQRGRGRRWPGGVGAWRKVGCSRAADRHGVCGCLPCWSQTYRVTSPLAGGCLTMVALGCKTRVMIWRRAASEPSFRKKRDSGILS